MMSLAKNYNGAFESVKAVFKICRRWGTENTGEKIQEWKLRHGNGGEENEGVKNACMVISKLNIGINCH